MLDKTKETWPLADYQKVFNERTRRNILFKKHPGMLKGAIDTYKNDPMLFINHHAMVHEPRSSFDPDVPSEIPMILFKRQKELVCFIYQCLKDQESGLIEKSRDMGATWCCVWLSIWLYLFWPGATIGWGSATAAKLDLIGNRDTIFEKIRMGLRSLPDELMPLGFSEDDLTSKRITNPENGAAIIGEIGEQIGRGGRSLITFCDESAHYEHPEAIEASLSHTTNVRIDISSVTGPNTVFHNKREAGIEWHPKLPMERGRVRVFVMDWSEHPAKTLEWYNREKADWERRGLAHIWAQEVDRDYGSAVEGVIIPTKWVMAAIDAHVKLGIPIEGRYGAALDIADLGGDTNALVAHRGPILTFAEEWGAPDPGVSARKAIALCKDLGDIDLQYDCVGIGSNIRSEANRLAADGAMPKNVFVVPWNAGGAVRDKDKHLIPGDRLSPKNGDHFHNLKAQGWWALRNRFLITYRAMTEEGFTYDTDDCISIPSDLPLLRKIQKELSQPVYIQSSSLKMMVDKVPDGARSPNIADAIMMAYFPERSHKMPRIPAKAFDWAMRPAGLRNTIGRRKPWQR